MHQKMPCEKGKLRRLDEGKLPVNPSSPSSRAPRDPGDYRAGGALELRGSGLPAGRGAGAQVSASAPGVRGHRPSNSA